MPPETTPDPGLTKRLLTAIREGGPLTFAAFMEAALYDPGGGFYSRPAVGEGGHFVTSPHVSPVFGILVAGQVAEFWTHLGRPDPFTFVEVGAGDGTLARQVLEALPGEVRDATRYIPVDRSETSREALRAAGFDPAAELSQVQQVAAGCVLANELLDNVPFHRVRRTPSGLAELYVTATGDRFEIIEGEPSSPVMEELTPDLPVGAEWVVSPQALRFVDQARDVLGRGYVWIVDYALGDPRGSVPASVHGYRRHALERDVLADPGSTDITAGVDFASLVRHASGLGLPVWGPVTQRDALLALGFRDLERAAQSRQREAIGKRLGIEAMRIYSNRTRANLLLAAGGLGDFLMLCFGVEIDRPPTFAGSG